MNNYREPSKVFDAAIKQGVLSTNADADNYAADWMYMGDNEKGEALFKNIVTRSYMPPVKVNLITLTQLEKDLLQALEHAQRALNAAPSFRVSLEPRMNSYDVASIVDRAIAKARAAA